MNRVTAVSAFALSLFVTGICQADSLVITYRSGKTQTVVLEEPSQGISSWQFIGGTASQQQAQQPGEVPAKEDQIRNNPAPQCTADKKQPETAPDKKSGIRIKWNAPPIRD